MGISLDDKKDNQNFTVRNQKGAGLVNYIQHLAFQDEEDGIMRIYIVRDNQSSEMVGYFSLKAGLISLNEQYGFSRLDHPYEDELHKRLKPHYDQSCKFMYQIS